MRPAVKQRVLAAHHLSGRVARYVPRNMSAVAQADWHQHGLDRRPPLQGHTNWALPVARSAVGWSRIVAAAHAARSRATRSYSHRRLQLMALHHFCHQWDQTAPHGYQFVSCTNWVDSQRRVVSLGRSSAIWSSIACSISGPGRGICGTVTTAAGKVGCGNPIGDRYSVI